MDIVWNISSDKTKNSFASVEYDNSIFGVVFRGELTPDRKAVIKKTFKDTLECYDKNKDKEYGRY